MHQQRVTHAVLARRTGRQQSSIKHMLKGTSLQTYILWELSMALDHNFFSDLSAQLNAATEGKLQQNTDRIEELEQENRKLKEERHYLRKAVDMISK